MFLSKKDYKILLPFSIIFLLFLGLNFYFNYKVIKSNIKRYEHELFYRVHGKIESWNTSNFKDINKIASLLQNEKLNSTDELNHILHKLQKSSNFPYLILGLDDGSFYISDSDYVTPHNYDLKSRAWYNDTLKANKTIASDPYISMRLGLRSVSICTPISLLNHKGVFCGGQPFEVIRKYFKEYQALYDKNLYLINKDGEILASFGKLNETIKFEDENLLQSNKYTSFNIKDTNWKIVFEKDERLYNNELGGYLLTNLLFYALCIAIYILMNFFWFRQNSQNANILKAQNSYIKSILTKQPNTTIINCDENLNIISKSSEFDNFFDFYQFTNLKKGIQNTNFLDNDNKKELLHELYLSMQSPQIRYFNIAFNTQNEQKSFLITTTSISNEAPYSISISFCDISLMQERQKSKFEEYNPQLEKLLIFIMQNLNDESLCIQKLAKATGYSKFYIQRLFKEYTNKSIATFLRETRLKRASFLLKFSNIKISYIAKKCGFSHTETFIRSFIKANGVSPLKYRQSNEPIKTNLIYQRIQKQSQKLAISYKKENIISFSSSKEIIVFPLNVNLQDPIFAIEADEKENTFATIELEGGEWIKIDIKKSSLNPIKALESAYSNFYSENSHLSIFNSYFKENINGEIDFLFIKI